MRGRILFVVGIAAGYVMGARAGRPAYDALMERLQRTASDPRVQQAEDRAKSAFQSRAPKAAAAVEDAAKSARGVAAAAKDAGTSGEGVPSSDQVGPTGSAD